MRLSVVGAPVTCAPKKEGADLYAASNLQRTFQASIPSSSNFDRLSSYIYISPSAGISPFTMAPRRAASLVNLNKNAGATSEM